MTKGRVVVVGLGPAGADLLLPRARTVISRMTHCYVRTARHPAVDELARHGLEFTSFDHHYESAAHLDDVYRAIADALVAAATEYGEVCYAVPGNPDVAERTVGLLREDAARGRVELEVIPGLSFADLVWTRLGVDPMAGARVVDGHSFAVEAAGLTGPLLVAQCDSRLVLSAVKLALLETLPPDAPVVVLERLGLADERVVTVSLEDLDRVVEPDHLTSVFVDCGHVAVAGEFAGLVALAELLRAPGGCPWDADQTHHSLARYLLEEAYETVETIEALPAEAPGGEADLAAYARLEDELGDLLFACVNLARHLAVDPESALRRTNAKFERRFRRVESLLAAAGKRPDQATLDEMERLWEQAKREERGS